MEITGTAHIGVLTVDFFIPQSASLKDKRSVLLQMRDKVTNTFNVSAAEIGYQDKWQRSQWVFCAVGADKAYLDGLMQKLLEFLRSGRQADVTDHQLEFV